MISTGAEREGSWRDRRFRPSSPRSDVTPRCYDRQPDATDNPSAIRLLAEHCGRQPDTTPHARNGRQTTATLHWVTDHERLWTRLARALRPGGVLEVQCGGKGNIDRVREVIDAVARNAHPELIEWSPWAFAGSQETELRLREAGFTETKCWLEERPTYPQDVDAFVRTSILAAHLARLPEERREPFAAAVVAGVPLPLDYVRLNVSAIRRAA